jgi:hypothetical protein
MLNLHPEYIIDENGTKKSVILPINDYNAIIEELEEFEDIKLYDEVLKAEEPSYPIDKAFQLIEAKHKG